MAQRVLPFEEVERQLRKRSFGILGTVTPKGAPHATCVLYGVSPPEEKLALYVVTERHYRKTRNVLADPHVWFVVPVPHAILRFVPPSCIQFPGAADVRSLDDPVGRAAFGQDRILRMSIEQAERDEYDAVFLRVRPGKRVFGYGLGISLLELRRDVGKGPFTTIVPDARR